MNLILWLDQVPGRYTTLAANLDVSVGRISRIADDGVALTHVKLIGEFTDEVVSL